MAGWIGDVFKQDWKEKYIRMDGRWMGVKREYLAGSLQTK